GGTYVVFSPDNGTLIAVLIGATNPPTLTLAWSVSNFGRGSPIVTTTDGSSEPIVWTAGSESSNRLHAYNGETGELIFAGGGPDEQMGLLRRFQTPFAVNGRILVAADNELFAFTVTDGQAPQAASSNIVPDNPPFKLPLWINAVLCMTTVGAMIWFFNRCQ